MLAFYLTLISLTCSFNTGKKILFIAQSQKLTAMVKEIGDVLELDTSQVTSSGDSDDKVYSAVTAKTKAKIMVFKINARNKKKV